MMGNQPTIAILPIVEKVRIEKLVTGISQRQNRLAKIDGNHYCQNFVQKSQTLLERYF